MAPGSFQVDVINSTSVRLSWQAVSGAGGYKVTYTSIASGSTVVKDVRNSQIQ